jgi:hypothetical protein
MNGSFGLTYNSILPGKLACSQVSDLTEKTNQQYDIGKHVGKKNG